MAIKTIIYNSVLASDFEFIYIQSVINLHHTSDDMSLKYLLQKQNN